MIRPVAVLFLLALLVLAAGHASAAEGELTGDLSVEGGFALAVWSGGHADELAEAARARGCNFRSLWVNRPAGGLVGYFPTRVSVVNEQFLSAYPGGLVPASPVLVVCGPASGAAQPPSARTLSLPPSMDNTLYEDPNGGLSNGVGQHLFAGTTDAGLVRRAVIAFDLSEIPEGASITRVRLRLNVSRTTSGERAVRVHRALSSWGEGSSDADGEEGGGAAATVADATWLHRFFPSSRWSAAGADFEASERATALVDQPGFYVWESDRLVDDVQAWVNEPATNLGWVIVGVEGQRRTTKRFDSREHPTPAQRPQLTIDFLPP